MEQLYSVNGLIFWTEREIASRRIVETHVVQAVKDSLKKQNRAWEFMQVEAPILTPSEFINRNYSAEDMYVVQVDHKGEALITRPETTMGSYIYAKHLLNPHNDIKVRLPLVVWQHGKSFRREQDQPTKFMRLKEFYQLEFQCLYSPSTATDYEPLLTASVHEALEQLVGECRITLSDRLPDYSERTVDIEYVDRSTESFSIEPTFMELCSVSKRKDFEGAKVLEVAVGTDRVVSKFLGL